MILYLVRHAKSSWDDRDLPDHERPLNDRGLSDAPRMFERLCTSAPKPEFILSSDAVRAASTARFLLQALGIEPESLSFDHALYHASPQNIVAAARALPESITTAAIVGHNPGMTYAANDLVDNLDLDNLPTCGIVGIEFTAKRWQDLDTGALSYFDFPKNQEGPLLMNPGSA